MSYGVSITSRGNQYQYLLDKEEEVRNLVNNAHLVTAVRVWNQKDGKSFELNKQEIEELLGLKDDVPTP